MQKYLKLGPTLANSGTLHPCGIKTISRVYKKFRMCQYHSIPKPFHNKHVHKAAIIILPNNPYTHKN